MNRICAVSALCTICGIKVVDQQKIIERLIAKLGKRQHGNCRQFSLEIFSNYS
jgi:hypothetical protein